jgi:hypothetical protein
MSPFAKFKDDINAVNVSADLLGEVMVMWASLPPQEWSEFEVRVTRVIEFLTKKNNYGKDPTFLACAITIRLMALNSVLNDTEFRGLLLPASQDGITYVHGDLLKAAAEGLVLEGPKGQPIFEAEPFRQRVLQMTESRGCA